MGIEISGGHFQPKLFYSSMKQIILHLSAHRCAAPFSFWEHFENRKRDRDEHDQRQSHVALSTFSRWSSGCHRRVPPAPYGMWAPVADTTLSCSGWPIQVPLELVLMLCLAVLLIVEIKKKPIPCIHLLWQSLLHPMGEIRCGLQRWRSCPRLLNLNVFMNCSSPPNLF